MRHTVLAAVFAISASAVLSFGCGSGAPPAADSFTKVYPEVIAKTCSSDYCHNISVNTPLDMSSKVRAYWSLVDQPCSGSNCYGQGTRVIPGQPENSIMYQKLSATTVQCGLQMPLDTDMFLKGTLQFSAALPQPQQDLIRNWIQDGAQNN